MRSPRSRFRALGAVLVVAVLATVTWAASPSVAATSRVDPGAWLKPGIPLRGQQHPDPSIVTVGPALISFATQHGGADLPVTWSAEGVKWIGRTPYSGELRYLDGDHGGFYNDAIVSPPWGVNSCVETSSNRASCDPKTLWAPGVALLGGQWVGYHAVRISDGYSSYGRFAIYRTTSSGAMGAFRSASGTAMVSSPTSVNPAGVIDPEVFTDPGTGKNYLLYKTEGSSSGNYPKIWARALDATGAAFVPGSSPKQLLTVSPGSWEGTVVENPSMIKVDGKYVLFYSGNRFSTTSYATGYAICKGPLGPCTKAGRLLVSKTGSYGPGGADAVIDDRGRYLLAYHAFPSRSGSSGVGGRVPHTAEFGIVDGKVTIYQRDVAYSPGSRDGVWWGESLDDGVDFTPQQMTITSSRIAFVADLDGDAVDDIGTYGSWDTSDGAVLTGPGRTLVAGGSGEVGQVGTFIPVSGDFNGDGRTDVFWYQPGIDPSFQTSEKYPRNDQVWLATASGGWSKSDISQERTAIPVVGDFDGDGRDEIWWIAPGRASDERWKWSMSASGFERTDASFPADWTLSPTVGDFDGDQKDDLLWVTPGASSATVWWSGSSSAATSIAVGSETQVFGRKAIAGDFDGDGADEILWYGLRGRPDSLWSGLAPGGSPRASTVSVAKDGTYAALVGDFDGDGRDDIFWAG